jgi:hypothetical protein
MTNKFEIVGGSQEKNRFAEGQAVKVESQEGKLEEGWAISGFENGPDGEKRVRVMKRGNGVAVENVVTMEELKEWNKEEVEGETEAEAEDKEEPEHRMAA